MSILITIILGIALLLMLAAMRTRSMAKNAEKIVPQPGELCSVDGGVLHYVDTGPQDGGVVVLIHGIAGQLQHYTYAMVDLLKDDYRVIAVDRPGCGYSSVSQGDGASLNDQSRMIDALLGVLCVNRVVVVGHSLGGAVALRLALDCPDRVAGLALLCPLTQAQPEAPDALKGLQVSTSWLRHLLGATIAVPMAKWTSDKVLTAVFHPESYPPDFMDRAGAALGLRPKAFITACSDMSAVHLEMPAQVARYADDLKVPGGILYGAEDAILSPDLHGQNMVAHGLTLETLPGRGHMIPITASQDCVDFVRRVAANTL